MWDGTQLRKLASGNYGLVDRDGVRGVGITDSQISTALIRGSWEQIHPGVYYLNATEMPWEAKVVAAVMAAGPGSVASHRTAGRLWNLDGIRSDVIELTVPYSNRPMPAGAIVHRTRRPRKAAKRNLVTVTEVERTLLDLASVLSPRILTRAVESAVRQRSTSGERLVEVLITDGGRGVTGTRALRRSVALVQEELTGSFAESDFNDLLRRAPVPTPRLQMGVTLSDGSTAYPDFCWPEMMKLVEIDGFIAHATPDQLQNDLRRQNSLMTLGWQVRRFTARDVRDRPLEVIGEIVRFINA